MAELTTQHGSNAGGPDNYDIAPPAGTPNVDDMGKDQIAGLLRESNAGGSQAAPVAPPVAPTPGQDPLEQLPPKEPEIPVTPEVKPDAGKPEDKTDESLANVYKKFGIVEPNEAVTKMAKSYSEAEKTLSQNFQAKSDAEKLGKENETLLGMAEDFQREINELKKAPVQSTQSIDPTASMTDKEIEEYNTNPKKMMAQMLQQALQPMQQKSVDQQKQNDRDKVMDYKVLSEVNKFKADKKFDGLEKDVDAILRDDNLPYTPQSVATAYHAARSLRMSEIVNTAKNEAFSQGYKKHEDEVKRMVDGGRSTVPAAGSDGLGGLSEESLDKMSAAEMSKLLPNSGV